MSRGSREQRIRRFLEEMPRQMLFALARGLDADVDHNTYKDELVDALVEYPLTALRRGLAAHVNVTDLRRTCKRLGYSDTGAQARLATRLIEAVLQPDARISRWRSFEQARAFARCLRLASQSEWWAFVRGDASRDIQLPDDIPKSPHAAYAKRGWTSWGDFLGTDNPARQLIRYRPFKQARAYVRSLGLANAVEWKKLCARKEGNRRVLPPDIPSSPDRVYADQGWISFGDWLGNEHVHASKIEYRSYDEARAFVRSLGIRTEPEWRTYCRGETHPETPRPDDVPTNPHRMYRGRGWVSWGHFFGTYSIAVYNRTYRSFAAARTYVRKQGITSAKEWRVWCAAGKRPADIPSCPDRVYAGKGWVSWGYFFGTENVHPSRRRWRSMTDATAIVRRLGIANKTEFVRAWHEGRIPKDIPLTIDRMPGWKSWDRFLGA
jgi:hypothetical protein